MIEIIGWSLKLEKETSLAAGEWLLKPQHHMLFHRGVQYVSKKFTNVVDSYKIITSRSRKGNCWDNAVAESFFKTLKTEQIYGNKLISKEQMERDI
jgi:transposase InsO family protein